MNRWIRNALLSSSLVGALALAPSAVAWAADASHDAGEAHCNKGHHGKGGNVLGAALKLDSLTDAQRASIQALVQQRHTTGAPVRAADAQFLTVLAHQVEQAAIDPQGLAPSLAAEQAAANARAGAERDALNQLHGILTPAQRGQLVDSLAKGHGHGEHAGHDAGRGGGHEGMAGGWFGRSLDLSQDQRAQIRANLQAQGAGTAPTGHGERGAMLQAFRGDSFDATAFLRPHDPGERVEKLAAAAVPVLTPAQRAAFADQLRRRAAHESA
jgi:Spy/CpxP family protein refolding chaperone